MANSVLNHFSNSNQDFLLRCFHCNAKSNVNQSHFMKFHLFVNVSPKTYFVWFCRYLCMQLWLLGPTERRERQTDGDLFLCLSESRVSKINDSFHFHSHSCPLPTLLCTTSIFKDSTSYIKYTLSKWSFLFHILIGFIYYNIVHNLRCKQLQKMKQFSTLTI
jgi:hypothetical protein